MQSLLEQIKNRRKELALRQHDMLLRVGMSRQQYQRLESKGNPRLGTLELLAKGLKSELFLVPQEKRQAVLIALAGEQDPLMEENKTAVADDPWRGLLGDDE